MNRLVVVFLSSLIIVNQAIAGSGTITVLDSTGATKTYGVITDGSGNFVSKMGICDQSAAANCAGVDAGKSLQVAGEGAAGTPAGGIVSIQGVSGGTNLPVSQATAASLNATVVGTGTFAVQAAESGTWTVQPGNTPNTTAWLVTGTGGTFPVTGTFWQTTQPVSAASLPLPTGAATQTTSAAILSTLGTPFQAGGSIGNTTFAATQSGTWNIGSISGTIVLPLGASTSANQSTEIGSLASIATNTTPYARAARNFPGCTVGTSTGLCLAANTAVTFLQVQNTSVAANIACAFGVSAVLNSSTSIQLAPGQPANWGPSTGGVPSGAMNCISSVASTPLYVEWN